METIYILHRGNVWGNEKISEEEIFNSIRLKEGTKFSLEESSKLQQVFQRKAEKYIKSKFSSKKVRVDLIIYSLVHQGGKPTKKYQAFCDINLYHQPKECPKLTRSFTFPGKLKELFKKYRKELQKEMGKQARKSSSPKGINEPSLISLENKLKKLVNQNYLLLTKILLEDKTENKRADAAWLLSWTDKEGISEVLFQALKDCSHAVHNNAAYSLLQLVKTKKISLKKGPVYDLLKHPSTICRNKGAFLLLEILKRDKELKISKDIREILVKMASSRQPNNSEPANMILELLKKRATFSKR